MVLGRYVSTRGRQRLRPLAYAALILVALIYGFAFGVFGKFVLQPLIVPLVALAGLVVWLLPDGERAPTRLLERLLIAFMIALCCWPDYLALSLPGLPWITAVRLIGMPMALVLLVCVSTSADFRATMKHILDASPAIWKMVAAFSVIAALSIGLSAHPTVSIGKFVSAQVNWTVVFFASCFVFAKPGRVIRFGRLMWGLAVFVAAIGVYEIRYSKVPWAGHIPWFLKIEDESVQRILAGASRAATGIYRVQSRFTTSLGLAEFLGFAMPFILHIMMTTRSLAVRVAAMASIPFLFWIIVRTDSRLGIIGFSLSIMLYMLAWGVMRWRSDKSSLFGPAVVLAYPAVFTAFVAATLVVARLRAMVWGNGPQSASNEARRQMYETGVPMVLRNPIGHGIGEGGPTLGFRNPAGTLTIDTYYLAVALEYGLLGFVIFYGMFGLAIWRSGKMLLDARDPETLFLIPVAIAMSNFIVSKAVFSQQENHPLIFMMLGIVVALASRERDRRGAAGATATPRARLVSRLRRPPGSGAGGLRPA